jgi:TonB family protein
MNQTPPSTGKWSGAFCVFILCLLVAASSYGQESRKLITQSIPAYPEVARRARLTGVVKVVVVIAQDGHVKEVRVVGGHPLFVNAALEALKQWKYAPSNSETTTGLEFNFHP